jgi:hypothetical protein
MAERGILSTGLEAGGTETGSALAEEAVVGTVAAPESMVGTGRGAGTGAADAEAGGTSLFWTKVLTAATLTSFLGLYGSTSLSKLWP